MTNATSSHRFPLRSHIRMLCGQIGVELDERDSLEGATAHADQWRGGKIRSNTIVVRRITDLQAYYTALHELGHIACKHRHSDNPARIIAKEVEAWEWAIDHAKQPPTEAIIQHIGRCLDSYTNHYGVGRATVNAPPPALKGAGPKGRLP